MSLSNFARAEYRRTAVLLATAHIVSEAAELGVEKAAAIRTT
jgi:hypothetical protein